MKKLLFGIVLVLFGISCLLGGQYWSVDFLGFIGVIAPFVGILFAVVGLLEKRDEKK